MTNLIGQSLRSVKVCAEILFIWSSPGQSTQELTVAIKCAVPPSLEKHSSFLNSDRLSPAIVVRLVVFLAFVARVVVVVVVGLFVVADIDLDVGVGTDDVEVSAFEDVNVKDHGVGVLVIRGDV